MGDYVINGGRRLEGSVVISGAKNSVLALLAGTLLMNGVCVLDNVPDISDVRLSVEILKSLGAKVTYPDKNNRNKLVIDTTKVDKCRAPYNLANQMRASYYFSGALLSRFKEAHVALPGGCHLGPRPVNLHESVFEALGANYSVEHGEMTLYADKLVGQRISFEFPSVGATINAMLASVFAEGTTIVVNAAKEPHVVDCANFLNAMGASIVGAGTDNIRIKGVKRFTDYVEYSVVPDQIEAGTYMAAAVATGGDVTIKNVTPKHLESIIGVIKRLGATVYESFDSVRVVADGSIKRTDVRTFPHPGFPTDMQPEIAAVLTLAPGTSTITDDIFKNRFEYASELCRMGADITVRGTSAIIEGVPRLTGCPVKASDLRAGAALVIAGLAAEGTTVITKTEFIERGYENIIGKIKMLGGDIVEVSESMADDSKKNA